MPDLYLERGRQEAGLSMTELWLRYFALGGNSTPVELEKFVGRAPKRSRHECNLIALAINEHCLEHGCGHPIPYLDEAEG